MGRSPILILIDVSSSIKRLSLADSTLSFDALVRLLKHTPALQHLKVKTLVPYDREVMDIPPLHLISLHLFYDSESTEDLIALLRQMPKLRRLQLDTEDLYISGSELKRIIVTHLLQVDSFQLNMNFQAPPGADREEIVSQSLATFQSPFWTTEHQWFMRCEWSLDEYRREIRLSTTSYPFDEYVVENYEQSMSILPGHHLPLSTTVHVPSIHHLADPSAPSRPPICSFSHVRHLVTDISCPDSLFTLIPCLDQLSSPTIDRFISEDVHADLQLLLNRATRLRRLVFNSWHHFAMKILQMKSRSIRELMIYGEDFNLEQCITLATSSLAQQCESLELQLQTFDCVAELLNRLPNLRVLTLQCLGNSGTIRTDDAECARVYHWLVNHFPNVSWHKQRSSDTIYVTGWIWWSINEKNNLFDFAGVQFIKKDESLEIDGSGATALLLFVLRPVAEKTFLINVSNTMEDRSIVLAFANAYLTKRTEKSKHSCAMDEW